jgi:SAM-dependent methyltransferase
VSRNAEIGLIKSEREVASLVELETRGERQRVTGYNGIRINAVKGLHEKAFHLLTRFVRPPARVADLGTGAGAFLQRLADNQFEVEGFDVDPSNFTPTALFRRLDLNKSFANQVNGPYDIITAIELIEHLENPRHFFRECSAALVSGGIFLITTPNIESSHSRVTFLLRGRFEWFEEDHYHSSGHLTPLTQWQLVQIARETGFDILSSDEGPLPTSSLKKRILISLLQPLMRGVTGADIRLLLLKKR